MGVLLFTVLIWRRPSEDLNTDAPEKRPGPGSLRMHQREQFRERENNQVISVGRDINTARKKLIHNNDMICQKKWQRKGRNERLCVGEPFMQEALLAIWSSCSRIKKAPLLDEGSHMTEKTGHAEVVRVVYQPEHISFEELLKVFWENHDPTQGMRQGNDHGTQYRSAIYPTSAKQMEAALSSKENYQKVLSEHGFGPITTDIREGQTFYYAEDYHQQYLSKNPNGYCGLGGTGVSCPVFMWT
nr:mitochondrial peptide methionine sulfoxide reductase isoform X2 [Pan troglodytes]